MGVWGRGSESFLGESVELGIYIDGRPLAYNQYAGTFAVGDAPVNAEQVRGYSAAGQIAWFSPGYRDWFNSSFLAAPTPAPPPATPVPTDRTVPATSAPRPVASVQAGMAETVQAIIPRAMIWSGFMGVHSKKYTLILTDKRVIFARSTTAGRKQRAADAQDIAKSEGQGFVGQVAARIDALLGWDEERYLTTLPDEALDERPDNFAVERGTITRAFLKTKRRLSSDPESGLSHVTIQELLVIKTRGKKYEIMLGLGRGQAAQALKAAGLRKWWAL